MAHFVDAGNIFTKFKNCTSVCHAVTMDFVYMSTVNPGDPDLLTFALITVVMTAVYRLQV